MDSLIQSLKDKKQNMHISPQGIKTILERHNPEQPAKNIFWATDLDVELPVCFPKFGPGSEVPMTLEETWQVTVGQFGEDPALSEKIDGNWVTFSYIEYYSAASKFACALVKHGIPDRSALSILR